VFHQRRGFRVVLLLLASTLGLEKESRSMRSSHPSVFDTAKCQSRRSNAQMFTSLLAAVCSSMSPARSVLLDLDGTLIDSQPGIFASCSAALRALGYDPGEALAMKRAIGPPLEDMLQTLLQAHGDDRIGEAVAAYRHHYGESGLLGRRLATITWQGQERRIRLSTIGGSLPASDTGAAIGPDEVRTPV
jgi:Haloacid dehalogenase-like hydrolase